MLKLALTVKKRSCLQWIGEIYCLILLFLPIAVNRATSIYTRTTPAQIWYKYTSFYFSALLVPAIIWAIVIRKKSSAIRFDLAIVAIVLKDLLMLAFSKQDWFVDYNFSFNFVLISAWSITCIVYFFSKDYDTTSVENFFDNYFVLAVMSQFLRLFLRLSTFGRYGAIGLSVGGTGYFAGLYLIYCLYYRDFTKKVRFLMVLALMSLVLSGQRSNLLFFLVFCIPYIIKKLMERRIAKSERGKFVFLWIVAGAGVLIIAAILFLSEIGIEIEGFKFITRTIEAIELAINGGINAELSVEGRLLSLNAGFDILKHNPFGITNNFYELQYRMLQYAYPTFPHNTLLCCYLLWSPFVTLVVLVFFIRLLYSVWRIKSGMLWPILYIFLYNIITGSVFLDYPYLTLNLFFVSLAKCKVNHAKVERQLQNESDE